MHEAHRYSVTLRRERMMARKGPATGALRVQSPHAVGSDGLIRYTTWNLFRKGAAGGSRPVWL